jgi:hypothetical protein
MSNGTITNTVGILDREQEKGQIEMARLEDLKVFAAFQNQNLSFTDPVNNGVINPVVTGNYGLSPEVAAQAFASVEQYDIPIANILVNAQQQRDLRSSQAEDINLAKSEKVLNGKGNSEERLSVNFMLKLEPC